MANHEGMRLLLVGSCLLLFAGAGGGAGRFVVEWGIKTGQVQFVIDEVIQCVFEAAREQLPLQVCGKETQAGVNVFVARHAFDGAIMHSMLMQAEAGCGD